MIDAQIPLLKYKGCDEIFEEVSPVSQPLDERSLFHSFVARLKSGDTLMVVTRRCIVRNKEEHAVVQSLLAKKKVSLRILDEK